MASHSLDRVAEVYGKAEGKLSILQKILNQQKPGKEKDFLQFHCWFNPDE